MIIKKKTNWFRMLFEWNGSVLPQLLPRLFILFLYTTAIVFFRDYLLQYHLYINPAIFTLFGIALAIFLGFRNTVSYDRFWEGRKLWGALLNDTRSLARQSHTLVDGADYQKQQTHFIMMLTALVHALKHQLRETNPDADMERLLANSYNQKLQSAIFKPIIILKELAIWVSKAKSDGKLDSITQVAFDENLNKLSDIIGGCERIASTPIPYTYSILLHRTVYIYCFLLPFGFGESMLWTLPFVVVFIAYTFVALEAIADELEDPFGIQPNDLALDAMSAMIESTLSEIDNQYIEPIKKSKYYYIT
ncbi:putative membrane protein [Flavobacterium sp. CG_23.5]|uniref:bestrophin family protein n=1 Tax=unclassified Flavobacterium TaxID=196869 RepID=UPI0018CB004F|nr:MULTISPECIES: bestrophin family ion channel [unclassified Flavobacterium]MBG6111316.1 putative membrane protein [Flavobacterium sp. CG_9.10]MBP2282103.1 putative membrane protein [Flavobacterium sp. CG_23.5]